MKPFRDLPIQRKMLLMTLLICGVVLLVAIAALFSFQVLNFRISFQRDTATLAAIIAENTTAALAFKDPKAAADVVGSLQAKPTVVAASLVLPDGTVFAQFGNPESPADFSQFPPPGKFSFTGRHLLYTQPVELEKTCVGTLYLRSEYRQTLLELLSLYGLVTLGVFVTSVGVAVAFSGRIRRIITDPILRLSQVALAVGEQKDYSLRVPPSSGGDELGRLTQCFNEMLGRIQTQDTALSLSQQKLEALVHSIDGIVWECSPDSLQFTFVSRQCERLLGYQPEEWLANPHFWEEKLHPQDAAKALQTGREMIARRQPYCYEYRMIAADSRAVWIRESGVVLIENDRPAVVRGIFQDITAQKSAAEELDRLNKQLMETSRHAGMAEVATGVLHNVGNVLNSVNVSLTLLRDLLEKSEVASLSRVAEMLQAQAAQAANFLATHPKGKLIPGFIIQVAHQLEQEHRRFREQHQRLTRNVEHIKEIVAMQQNYANVSGIREAISIPALVDDALQIHTAGLERHGVRIVRDFSEVPPILVDKHKVLQILVNLIHNAKYALDASGRADRVLTVAIALNGDQRVKVSVRDNGIGIPPENLTRIFSLGFTTRKGGHGFGLHSGANAAKEMGGILKAHSEGPGQGATFTLELPILTGQTHS
ncbi:MAG TPA: ATP-binding protein [Verrucomicrobiae bacterium]|nr:ATP-binding protein [Verrucomicrobiae bacterium]